MNSAAHITDRFSLWEKLETGKNAAEAHSICQEANKVIKNYNSPSISAY